jgi:N-acetylglucosamine kinase-like BadF-type ATPase
VRVVNDAAIALMAGAPDGVGIVVLAGTGSISYGQDRAGKSARAGGFGFLLADEGSGIGWAPGPARDGARRGRTGPETRMMPIVFEALEVSSVSELVPRVYEKGLPKHRIAALAGVVQRARDEGDAVAAELIESGGARAGPGRARGRAASSTSATDPSRWCWRGARSRPAPRWSPPREAPRSARRPSRPAPVEPARGAVRLALDLLQP